MIDLSCDLKSAIAPEPSSTGDVLYMLSAKLFGDLELAKDIEGVTPYGADAVNYTHVQIDGTKKIKVVAVLSSYNWSCSPGGVKTISGWISKKNGAQIKAKAKSIKDNTASNVAIWGASFDKESKKWIEKLWVAGGTGTFSGQIVAGSGGGRLGINVGDPVAALLPFNTEWCEFYMNLSPAGNGMFDINYAIGPTEKVTYIYGIKVGDAAAEALPGA